MAEDRPARLLLRSCTIQETHAMASLKRHRKKADKPVVAVQLALDFDGFAYIFQCLFVTAYRISY